jgi:hypothetical protein
MPLAAHARAVCCPPATATTFRIYMAVWHTSAASFCIFPSLNFFFFLEKETLPRRNELCHGSYHGELKFGPPLMSRARAPSLLSISTLSSRENPCATIESALAPIPPPALAIVAFECYRHCSLIAHCCCLCAFVLGHVQRVVSHRLFADVFAETTLWWLADGGPVVSRDDGRSPFSEVEMAAPAVLYGPSPLDDGKARSRAVG